MAWAPLAILNQENLELRRRVVVMFTWLLMSATLLSYIGVEGRNLPTRDEWAFVADYFAGFGHQWYWLGQTHLEHRYPLGRALVLVLFELSGHDYRSGQWASGLVLSCAAYLWISAARRLRGHTSMTDALFPVLLLHRGHGENLLMGYQLVYTLTALGLGLFVLAISDSNRGQSRLGKWLACVAGMICSLGGGVGIVFAIPIWAWLMFHCVSDFRRGWPVLLVSLLPVIYTAWSIVDAQSRSHQVEFSTSRFGRVLLEVCQIAGGDRFARSPLPIAWFVLFLCVAATLQLLRNLRHRAAIGLLAILVGSVGFLLAIAYTRPTGSATRFALFSAATPAAAMLVFARFPIDGFGLTQRLSPRLRTLMNAAVTLLVAVGLIRENWIAGQWFARNQTYEYMQAITDSDRGVPISIFAERNKNFWIASPLEAWTILTRSGFNRRIQPAEAIHFHVIRQAKLVEDVDPNPGLPFRFPRTLPGTVRHRIEIPDDGRFRAIRLHTRQTEEIQSEPIRLVWITRNANDLKNLQSDDIKPWLRAPADTTAFWVSDRFDNTAEQMMSAWVIRLKPESRVEFTAVEFLR